MDGHLKSNPINLQGTFRTAHFDCNDTVLPAEGPFPLTNNCCLPTQREPSDNVRKQIHKRKLVMN